ncbi:MAG TPA: hypothetical protein VK846_16550 [Candidatus Limnocylindria bacterium]|nr:hypothetical protein [Candidatus Limnocylindria bacterium]
MQAAQDFFENYLRQSAALEETRRRQSQQLHEKFYSKDYLGHLLRAWTEKIPETFLTAEESNGKALIVTMSGHRERQQKYRYRLHVLAEGWEIHRLETECFACDGTGNKGQSACKYCRENGWVDWLCDAT